MARLFKILPVSFWARAHALGHLPWSAVDQADGFVHLSTGLQVKETATIHFSQQAQLVLIELDASRLSELRYEPSRGGALFPHVYADVPFEAVLHHHLLVGSEPGVFDWPPDLD